MWHLEQSVMISYSFGIICWTNGLLLSVHSMTFQDIVFICLDCLDAIIDNSEEKEKKCTVKDDPKGFLKFCIPFGSNFLSVDKSRWSRWAPHAYPTIQTPHWATEGLNTREATSDCCRVHLHAGVVHLHSVIKVVKYASVRPPTKPHEGAAQQPEGRHAEAGEGIPKDGVD